MLWAIGLKTSTNGDTQSAKMAWALPIPSSATASELGRALGLISRHADDGALRRELTAVSELGKAPGWGVDVEEHGIESTAAAELAAIPGGGADGEADGLESTAAAELANALERAAGDEATAASELAGASSWSDEESPHMAKKSENKLLLAMSGPRRSG